MYSTQINRHEWLKAVTQDANLPDRVTKVAVALWSFANDESGQIDPRITLLAEFVKRHKATVKRAISDLVQAGWLGKTEGRGRGNYTSYTLCSPGKIIPISAKEKGSKPPSQKGAAVRLYGSQKGAALHRKGCSSAPFYYKDKQPLEQKGRAPDERPSPHLNFIVHHNSFHEDDWNAWLDARGYPPLREIGERGSDADGTGWVMPRRSPPTAEDTAIRVAEKRVWWLINRANQRAGSEVRYAAQ